MKESIKKRIEAVRRGEVLEGYCKVHPYVIPYDWSVVKLGNVTKRTSRPNKDGQDRPAYSINNRKGFVPQNEQFEEGSYEDLDKSAYKIVRKGEFAYNPARVNVGSIGRLRDAEEVAVSSLYVCVSVDGKVDGDYFNAWTKSQDFYKETVRNTEGSVREYLFYENFANMRIPIPTVAEQQKIAEILETCDRMIELKQSKIDELNKLKQVCLLEMFPQKGQTIPKRRFPGFSAPWEQRKLGEITESYSGGTPTAGKKEYYDGNIPFIRSGEIGSDKTELFISDEGLNNSSAKMVKTGDILYALYGATSGEVNISKLKGAINQAILAIRPYQNYDSQFLMQWLRKSKETIIGTYLQGGQGNLSGNIVKELLVDVPTSAEQKQIGNYFANLDNLITLHQRELAEVGKYKKALMQLLLTGLMRVNA